MTKRRQVGAADTHDIRKLITGYQAARALLAAHEIGFARDVSARDVSARDVSARDVSDRVAFFREGKIEEIGPPIQVIQNPKSDPTRQFPSKVR